MLREGGAVEDLFENLDDKRFNLIVIGQPESAVQALALNHLMHVLVIPADAVNEKALVHAKLSGPSFYLLRPDGHVGLAGTRFDAAAVTRYLTDCHISLDPLRAKSPPAAVASFTTTANQPSVWC